MSTAQAAPNSTVGPTKPTLKAAGFAGLVGIELRKMVNTRAAMWTMIVAIGIPTVVTLALALLGKTDRIFGDFVTSFALIVTLILPVVAVMSYTSEWTQRTSLTTFSLVPARMQIFGAKFLASLVLAVAAFAFLVLISAVAWATDGSQEAPAQLSFGFEKSMGTLVYLSLFLMMGAAFGAFLMNTATGIVAFYLTQFGILISSQFSGWLAENRIWWSPLDAWVVLIDKGFSLNGSDLGRVLTNVLFWIVLPLVGGALMWRRREAK